MKKKSVWYSGLSVLLFALYLVVPACGSKGNNAAAPIPINPGYNQNFNGQNCLPNQVCSNFGGGIGPGGGIPLIETPAIATGFDPYGSNIALNFYAPGVVPGQVYSGQVNIAGQMSISGPPGACPAPGLYNIQGTGTYIPGYGGADFGVNGNLQIISQQGGQAGAGILNISSVHRMQGGSYVLATQIGLPSCPDPISPTGYRLITTPYN